MKTISKSKLLENKLRRMVREELLKEAQQEKIINVTRDFVDVNVPDSDKAIAWVGRISGLNLKMNKVDDNTIRVRTYELLQYAVNQIF